MAECMALSCPRLSNTDPTNRDFSATIPSSLVTYSVTKHPFCNHCSKARRLLDWAHARQYPAIRARYGASHVAIGAGEWNWVTSIVASRQDAIDALFSEAIGDDVPEEFGEIQKVVTMKSKPRWQPRRRA